MEHSYQGFHREVASFAGTVQPGDPVALSGNGTVAPAEDGQEFIGVCVSRQGDLAGVQLCGAVEAGFTGAPPALGYGALAAAGSQAVKSAESGRSRLILSVDEDAGRGGFPP